MNGLVLAVLLPALVALYIWFNDRKLVRYPDEATHISAQRWKGEEVQRCYNQLQEAKVASLLEGKLPPKTGRRYIVIGGAGFLGGWIVLHLLQRGEDPRNIRVLDLRAPTRRDLLEGSAKDVEFVQVDIANRDAVFAAFQKPWPGSNDAPVTVFHTAATIRFFERHPDLLHLSEAVNVHGTQNVLDAARATGTSILVYTSSGSVAVRRSQFMLLPWQQEPPYFTQVINDDDNNLPKQHNQFFSNYAASKLSAERRVRAADRSDTGSGVLRTGCIRPGNGIYGPGGDLLIQMYIVRKYNPSWIGSIMQSFSFVENCSLAHLLYEQRLIELEDGGKNPDIGGQAFCIADSGPPPTYGDAYRALEQLTNREVTFPHWSPTAMYGIAHLVEAYYLAQRFLSQSRFAAFSWLMPKLTGDAVFLQPSMFALTNVHLYFDDSRARLSPEKGGLGYINTCTTLEGVCQVVADYYRNGTEAITRPITGHAENQSPLTGAEQAVGSVVEKLGDGLDAAKAMN